MNDQRKKIIVKIRQSSARWLGLALACGTLTFAITTQAGKPVKPPPTPSSPAYVPVLLGGLRSSDGVIKMSAFDINNAGQVVGSTAIPSSTSSQAFLLNPQDVNGDGKLEWFVDKDADGQNDLIIGLGMLPGANNSQAAAVNALGMVVGTSGAEGFIVVPDGSDWYQDSNRDGINDLMVPLGKLQETDDCTAEDINNLGQIVGWCGGMDANGVYHLAGFLLTPVVDAQGAQQWFQETTDGSGANALMVNLGAFKPASINDSGQVVGTMSGRAMLRNPAGSLIDLKAAGTESEAVAINNRGQIGVCVHLSSDPLSDRRARLLTPVDTNNDGTPEIWCRDLNADGVNDLILDMGTAQGLSNSGLGGHSVNDAGSVVGVSFSNPGGRFGPGKRAPFLWQNGVIRSLKDLTGGTIDFWEVSAINNAGQIVCRTAHDSPHILLPKP
jgi:uncharacterized membrane protein